MMEGKIYFSSLFGMGFMRHIDGLNELIIKNNFALCMEKKMLSK